MNDNRFYKLHIFSAGTHKSASGHTCTLTQDDLNNTADVLNLSMQQIASIDGFKDLKIKNVQQSIEFSKKNIVLSRLINALCIPSIGKSLATYSPKPHQGY